MEHDCAWDYIYIYIYIERERERETREAALGYNFYFLSQHIICFPSKGIGFPFWQVHVRALIEIFNHFL
jgi:hypothetical protein